MSVGRSPRRLVVNADDFGFSPGVTEGILRAHAEGVVTSTTIAANMPAAEEAVGRLGEAPRLGVGVHLNVTQGPVLSEAGRALAGPGGVMDRSAAGLLAAVTRRPGLLDAVEAECEAQLLWLLDCGVRPTHLDSHRHVHAWPGVFARVARLARRYHVPFVRWYEEHLPGCGWPRPDRRQRRITTALNVLAVGMRCLAPDLRGTRGTWGVGQTGRLDAGWLVRAARRLPAGAWEIMAHPGFGEDLDPSQTRLIAARRAELDALCDPQVRAALQANGIELVNYGQL